MKVLTGLALLIGLAACNTRGDQETGRAGGDARVGADTIVTTRQMQDTAIVTSDTTVRVDVDTNRKEGGVVDRDTVKH